MVANVPLLTKCCVPCRFVYTIRLSICQLPGNPRRSRRPMKTLFFSSRLVHRMKHKKLKEKVFFFLNVQHKKQLKNLILLPIISEKVTSDGVRDFNTYSNNVVFFTPSLYQLKFWHNRCKYKFGLEHFLVLWLILRRSLTIV